jgi:hypothetical protein
LAIWQNWSFGPFYHSRIEVLQIAHLLALVSERKSKIERKFKTKNPDHCKTTVEIGLKAEDLKWKTFCQ